jgi:hypothetical protein
MYSRCCATHTVVRFVQRGRGRGGTGRLGEGGRDGWLGMGRACLIQIPSSNREEKFETETGRRKSGDRDLK